MLTVPTQLADVRDGEGLGESLPRSAASGGGAPAGALAADVRAAGYRVR